MNQTAASVYPTDQFPEFIGRLRNALELNSAENKILAALLSQICDLLSSILLSFTRIVEQAAQAAEPYTKPNHPLDEQNPRCGSNPSAPPAPRQTCAPGTTQPPARTPTHAAARSANPAPRPTAPVDPPSRCKITRWTRPITLA